MLPPYREQSTDRADTRHQKSHRRIRAESDRQCRGDAGSEGSERGHGPGEHPVESTIGVGSPPIGDGGRLHQSERASDRSGDDRSREDPYRVNDRGVDGEDDRTQ